MARRSKTLEMSSEVIDRAIPEVKPSNIFEQLLPFKVKKSNEALPEDVISALIDFGRAASCIAAGDWSSEYREQTLT